MSRSILLQLVRVQYVTACFKSRESFHIRYLGLETCISLSVHWFILHRYSIRVAYQGMVRPIPVSRFRCMATGRCE